MKNLKKISREVLKKVKGAGGGPTLPNDSIFDCQCLPPDGYSTEHHACINRYGGYYDPICYGG